MEQLSLCATQLRRSLRTATKIQHSEKKNLGMTITEDISKKDSGKNKKTWRKLESKKFSRDRILSCRRTVNYFHIEEIWKNDDGHLRLTAVYIGRYLNNSENNSWETNYKQKI